MKLVPFKPEDANQLISWFSDKEGALLWGGRVFGWPLTAQSINHRHLQADVSFYFLDHNSQNAGFIEILRVSDAEYRLCRVAISKAAGRGRGLGKQLIQAAIQHITETTDAKLVTLAVFKSNERAFRCYQSAGFKVTEKGPKLKVFDGVEWPLYQMELRL